MTLEPKEIWDRIIQVARRELGEQTFRTWLEPCIPVSTARDVLVVAAPDQFSADWNEGKFADQLSSCAPVALGRPYRVTFVVSDDTRQRIQMDLFTASPPKAKQPSPERFSIERPILSARYTFSNFVIGKSNELAAAAAAAVAKAPGRVYNPLFIYGSTGLGKTHLMQAVAHEILESNPNHRLIYTGAEQFTNDYVTAIQNRGTSEFRRRYREADLLLIDDIHFLKGKEATQEEFFHTFNALYEAGRQILITSDRAPSDIPAIEARLVTRFQWGMVTDIEPPDFEHRVAILRKKAQIDRLEHAIPDEVLELLAEIVTSSVRELEGSVIRLLAYSSLKQRPITLDLAKQILQGKVHTPTPRVTANLSPNTILTAIAHQWTIPPDTLTSKSRTKSVVIPRQAAIYLCRKLLAMSLMEIGAVFGSRDHSTIIYSLQKAQILLNKDPIFASRVAQAEQQIARSIKT